MRPYWLVEDIHEAVERVAQQDARIVMMPMDALSLAASLWLASHLEGRDNGPGQGFDFL